jgi:hypothetical protein
VTNAQLGGSNERPDERSSDGVGKKADAVISFVGFALQTRNGEDASKGQLGCFRMVAKLG